MRDIVLEIDFLRIACAAACVFERGEHYAIGIFSLYLADVSAPVAS